MNLDLLNAVLIELVNQPLFCHSLLLISIALSFIAVIALEIPIKILPVSHLLINPQRLEVQANRVVISQIRGPKTWSKVMPPHNRILPYVLLYAAYYTQFRDNPVNEDDLSCRQILLSWTKVQDQALSYSREIFPNMLPVLW